MRAVCLVGLYIFAGVAALAQTPSVGSGAPTAAIQSRFVTAFYRNGFSNLVTLPPLGDVKTFGGAGLVQEFQDAQKNKYALILPDVSAPVLQDVIDIFQLTPGLYSYYTSIGPTTAGFPTIDSSPCPPLTSTSSTCQYEIFTKNYALFVFGASSQSGGTNFATRDPFFTKWSSLGGIAQLGPTVSAEQMITSSAGTAATTQAFDRGAIFNITSGTLNGRLVAIGPVVYPLYVSNKGYSGFLGLPAADEITLPNGHKRQTFEGGAIEYDSSGVPVLRFPVASIAIAPSSSRLNLNLGDSMVLTATLFDPNGSALTDRTISWSTSNSRVVSIQPSGATVTIKAVGGGSAIITATSEGKTSPPIAVFVIAPCCDIGEGAPTPAVQQAFQDAVTRNRVKLQLPAATPVHRLGNGYSQDAQDMQGTAYLITVADHAAAGYISFGALLGRYLELGGPAGSLGYPVSDITSGGTQLFQNNTALAGNPPRMVSGNFLSKWAALGYENGAAGAPASDITGVLTFRGTLGNVQSFSNGLLLAARTDAQTGKVYFVSGPVLASYTQAGGAGGQLGLPTDDDYNASGKRRQDFEGGFADYASGDQAAQIHPTDRVPIVTATPATVLAGTRVRISTGGFDPGSTLRVSVSGQPDFTVQTDNGAYSWEIVVPASAKTSTVSIRAVDTSSTVSADGSYTVRALAEAQLRIAKISGDGQTGLPAAVLPQLLEVAVQDDSGNPAAGIPVTFSASPGAQIVSASAITDENGQAEAMLRLPSADGVALATAQAGRQIVTFSAQVIHSSLTGFPSFTQVADVPLGRGPDTITAKGSLLTSVAAVVRFYQNRALLPSSNGFADPQTLNQFLKSFCVLDSKGAQICDGFVSPADSQEQFVNLWRVTAFAGNGLDVSIESPALGHIHDLLGQGAPVILALALSAHGNAAGGHYVVAIGTTADGSITIADPNPAFGRSNLSDYLAGFGSVKGRVVGAIRLVPRAPVSTGFLVIGDPVFEISSPTGPCGSNLDLPAVNASGALAAASPAQLRFRFCDGTQSLYELETAADGTFRLTFTDLSDVGSQQYLSGSGSAAYKIARSGAQWTASPQALSFAANGVVNAASFTPDIAPGGLFAIFGSGLSAAGAKTTVQIGASDAPVVAATPFQIDAQMPPDLAPGTYSIHLSSPYGDMQQPVSVRDVAPAVFTLAGNAGAILNQSGNLNAPDSPARRGEAVIIFCTGLGAVTSQGAFEIAQAPVTVAIAAAQLKPIFSGLAPGFIGLYQVNVILPIDIPPGVNLPLHLSQGATASNTVSVSIQ